jgi:hypothetical protein
MAGSALGRAVVLITARSRRTPAWPGLEEAAVVDEAEVFGFFGGSAGPDGGQQPRQWGPAAHRVDDQVGGELAVSQMNAGDPLVSVGATVPRQANAKETQYSGGLGLATRTFGIILDAICGGGRPAL